MTKQKAMFNNKTLIAGLNWKTIYRSPKKEFRYLFIINKKIPKELQSL